MLRRIAEVMDKPVNRSTNEDESPFASLTTELQDLEQTLRDLTAEGENHQVEFKSSGRKNLYTGSKDPAIEWSIVKSVAAFMNTDGGRLLVGITDAGTPAGIEPDYGLVHGANRDGWELWLTDLISSGLGKTSATAIKVRYGILEGQTVALIEVPRSAQPVFATPTKAANPFKGKFGQRERVFFYVRTGNATKELIGGEMLKYTKAHWPATT